MSSFCGRTRRQMLWETGAGFGGVALSGLLGGDFFVSQSLAADGKTPFKNPLAPKKPHFPVKAKSVIWLFMNGGQSQVDTWDYKPKLAALDGKDLPGFDKNTGFFTDQVGGLTAWQGKIVAATLGGLVLVDPATREGTKLLASPGGLPSNQVLAVAVGPSGILWAGTADKGVARLVPGGGFKRTLTSFDGLPSDHVQTIYVHGDSVWVGTSGGLVRFDHGRWNRFSTAEGLINDHIGYTLEDGSADGVDLGRHGRGR